jgi:undecaprenyl pyrophosphate synthase
MEVGQGQNWGCSAKGKKTAVKLHIIPITVGNRDWAVKKVTRMQHTA